MTEYSFTLILTGDADAHLDELYEAGCDDATVGLVDGVAFADFDREAATLDAAIISAIEAVESVPELRVARVEPDDLVTASEIAARLGRTRESVRLLIAGRRGHGSFPGPISHLRTRNRLWRWSEVSAWAGESTSEQTAVAELVAAINAALELRTHALRLPARERINVYESVIRPLHLEAATAETGVFAGSKAPSRLPEPEVRPSGSASAGPPVKRSHSVAPGNRAQQAVAKISEQPGITASELAKSMGIKANYLYRVLPQLERESQVTKQGRGYHPVDDGAAGAPSSKRRPVDS